MNDDRFEQKNSMPESEKEKQLAEAFDAVMNSTMKIMFKLAEKGYSKGQILEYLNQYDTPNPIPLYSAFQDYFSRLCDNVLAVFEQQELANAIQGAYQQMERQTELSYIGKDGMDYYTRQALNEADERYVEQMNPKHR